MNNVGEKFLPLGTVVMLKGASKRLMITGFCTMAAEEAEGVMYDYSGCMYPEGMISSDQTALFNHDQIEKIYHLGLVDQEEKDFKIKLNQLLYANSPVAESAPQAIREQEGVVPVVPSAPTLVQPVAEVPVAPAAPVQPVEVPVPPIGPGLPGYVAPVAAPSPVAPVAQPVTSGGFQFDANGNVIAAPTQVAPTAPVAQPATSGGFQFDANGNVIAAPTPETVVPEGGSGEAPAAPNYQFDANGTVISA